MTHLYDRMNSDGRLPVSISVRDLAGQPHLRMEVLAGASGLDSDVTWDRGPEAAALLRRL